MIKDIFLFILIIASSSCIAKADTQDFWFKGNTLYWGEKGKESGNNFLLFSMNQCDVTKPMSQCHLDLNDELIESIVRKSDKLIVSTGHYQWEVLNINDSTDKWIVIRTK